MNINAAAAPSRGQPFYEGRIPSDLSLVTPLAVRLASELLARGLVAAADRDKLEVCFEEALKNAIVHGNRLNPETVVIVRLFQDEDSWGVMVQDQGRGFEKSKVPDPEERIFPWRENGRGIRLMCHIMESVEYFSGGKQVMMSAKLWLRKPRLSPVPSPPARDVLQVIQRDGAVIAPIRHAGAREKRIASTFQRLQEVVESSGARLLILDLSAVHYLSSYAIGRMVALYRTCQRLEIALVLAEVNAEINEVFAQMRLDLLFPFAASVEEALEMASP